MKISTGIILFTVVLTSCLTRKEEKRQEVDSGTVQLLKNFVADSDTVYRLKYDDRIFHLDTLINECSVNNNIHTALIYILNSECSACFERLFDFLFYFQEIKETMPVVVIAEAGNKEIFKYYVEQIPLAIEDLRCIENANNKYIEGRLTLYNGIIFYLYKDKIIKSLSFETLFGTNQMN